MKRYARHFAHDVVRSTLATAAVVSLTLGLQIAIRAATRLADGAAFERVRDDVIRQLATRLFAALPVLCALGFTLALRRWVWTGQNEMVEAVGFSVRKVVRWGAALAFAVLMLGHLGLAPLAGQDARDLRHIEQARAVTGSPSPALALLSRRDGSFSVVRAHATAGLPQVEAQYFAAGVDPQLTDHVAQLTDVTAHEWVVRLLWLMLVLALLPFGTDQVHGLSLVAALAWPVAAWAVWIVVRRVGVEFISVAPAEGLALAAVGLTHASGRLLGRVVQSDSSA